MRYIFTTLALFVLFSCKAQTVVSLANDSDLAFTNGTYNKDVDNDFNKYVGTWKFIQGNTTLTLELKKLTFNHYQSKNYYEDLLVGEYRFIENGVEKINTLSQMINPPAKAGYHNIWGNLIWTKNLFPKCDDCSQNERRIKLYITDPERKYLDNAVILRYKNENGVERIIARIYKNDTSVMLQKGSPDEMRVPYGEYVLTKQP